MTYSQGKPFRLPPRTKTHVDAAFRAKDRLVNVTVARMATVIDHAIVEIFDRFFRTEQYVEPNLYGMSSVTEQFYRDVITEAWTHTRDMRRALPQKKKLASGPAMPPKGAKSLHDIFQNSRYFKGVMRRSEAMTKRMKKNYLGKLKEKFNEIVPLIRSGEISHEEAKTQMSEAWDASRARVTTIFRTETTNYFARSQVAFFENEADIIGFLFDSIRDTARTDICKSRHGLVYRPGTALLRENTPALHYNCRSHLIPLANTPMNRKMLQDEGRNPENRRVAPVPSDWIK